MSVVKIITILQSQEIINRLQELGFREYESKVFIALLKGHSLSASEIAKLSNVPRSAVYDVLNTFVEKGYCNEIETNTITKFEIIDPNIISDKIERDFVLENREKLKKLKTTFNEIEPIYKTETEQEKTNVNIELIRGFNKHRHEKFIELLKDAESEVLFMIRVEGFISDEIDERASSFIRNGGVIKSLYEASENFKIIKNDSRVEGSIQELLKLCETFESTGEQIRISTKELPNITIFDRKTVFINITDKNIPRHNKSDIIIRNEDFALKMVDLFNFYWGESFSIKELEKIYKNKSEVQ